MELIFSGSLGAALPAAPGSLGQTAFQQFALLSPGGHGFAIIRVTVAARGRLHLLGANHKAIGHRSAY